MQNNIINVMLIVATVFTSCKKDVPSTSSQDAAIASTDRLLAHNIPAAKTSLLFANCGNWHIASLIKNDMDLTAEYQPYLFIFCPGNIFTMSNDAVTYNDKWWLFLPGDENTGIESNSSYLRLQLNVQSNSTKKEIAPYAVQGNWKINERTNNTISLQYEGGSAFLEFVRENR